MKDLKYTIDLLKKEYNLLGRENSCKAIDEAVITSIRILAKHYLECVCSACGVKQQCHNRYQKDCRYIKELEEELNKLEIKL